MHKILLTRDKREIAYKHYKGKSKIGFLFFPGFNSDMLGTKAIHIYDWCKKINFSAHYLITLVMENPLENLLMVALKNGLRMLMQYCIM